MRLTQRMNDGCDTICENCPMKGKCSDSQDCVNVLAERLSVYEDAEEQGLLVRLPCKVGDTVYEVVKKRVDLTGYRMEWGWETAVEAVPFRIGMADAIGKTVFLTRTEAETALMKGENIG